MIAPRERESIATVPKKLLPFSRDSFIDWPSFYTQNEEIRMDEGNMYESEVITFAAPKQSGWLKKKSTGEVLFVKQANSFLGTLGCVDSDRRILGYVSFYFRWQMFYARHHPFTSKNLSL